MLHNIQMDLKRAVFSYKTLGALLGITALWYFNSMRFTYQEDLIFLFVYTKGLTITTYLALTISNVSYGTSFCEDFRNHAMRTIIIRSSIKKYVLSKIFVCCLVTLATYMLGTMLFVIIKMFDLSIMATASSTVANIKDASCFSILLPNHPCIFMLIQTIFDGMCCSIMSIASLCVSVFIPNTFIVLCTPIVIFFVQEIVFENILKLPFSLENTFFACFTDINNLGMFFLRVFSVFLIYIIVFGLLFYKQVKRRLENA